MELVSGCNQTSEASVANEAKKKKTHWCWRETDCARCDSARMMLATPHLSSPASRTRAQHLRLKRSRNRKVRDQTWHSVFPPDLLFKRLLNWTAWGCLCQCSRKRWIFKKKFVLCLVPGETEHHDSCVIRCGRVWGSVQDRKRKCKTLVRHWQHTPFRVGWSLSW